MSWQAEGEATPAYRFTDKEDDAASGAVYIGARHYLPALGRWASPDPLHLSDPGSCSELRERRGRTATWRGARWRRWTRRG